MRMVARLALPAAGGGAFLGRVPALPAERFVFAFFAIDASP